MASRRKLRGNGSTQADLDTTTAADARPVTEGDVAAPPPEEVGADLSAVAAIRGSHTEENEKALTAYGQNFVNKFYQKLRVEPKRIYKLYADNANRMWAIHKFEDSYGISTAKAIKDFWAASPQDLIELHEYCFVVQKSGDLTLIMVNGSCKGFGVYHSNFVEAFLLNESSLIVNDVLIVFQDGKPLRLPKGTPRKQQLLGPVISESLPTKQVAPGPKKQLLPVVSESVPSQLRRHSSRILEQNNKLKGSKAEARSTIMTEPKCTVDANIRKRANPKVLEIPSCTEPSEGISVAILYDKIMLEHRPQHYCLGDNILLKDHKTEYDPFEIPERISCIIEKFVKENLFDRVLHVKHESASLEDMVAVHGEDYMTFVNGLPLSPEANDEYIGYYTNDMYCSDGTRDAVFSAAGATIKACDLVIRDVFKQAFAVVRPPGHHAAKGVAEGFCYANNIAIGADYLRRIHGTKKTFVVDWDAHYGNGSQELFYTSNEVLFFNTFNMDLDYPYTSKNSHELAGQIGKGKGAGYNVNIPLRSGFGDGDMLFIWENLLLPLLREFSADIVLISCGYDAAKGDPLGGAKLSEPCYATLLDMIVKCGNGKVVLALEGGYNLKVLANCASHCVRALIGDRKSLLKNKNVLPKPETVEIVEIVKRNISRYWEVFKSAR